MGDKNGLGNDPGTPLWSTPKAEPTSCGGMLIASYCICSALPALTLVTGSAATAARNGLARPGCSRCHLLRTGLQAFRIQERMPPLPRLRKPGAVQDLGAPHRGAPDTSSTTTRSAIVSTENDKPDGNLKRLDPSPALPEFVPRLDREPWVRTFCGDVTLHGAEFV